MTTKNGAKAKGLPDGINIDNQSDLKFTILNQVHANHILKLRPNVTIICAVGVNVYGTIPTILHIAINKNIVKIKGKYLLPEVPILSFTTSLIFSYINSITDCHLPGIKLPFFILLVINQCIINTAINKNNDEFVNDISKFPNGCKGINLVISNCSNVLFIIFSYFFI
jgi:hypothetical protein